MPAGPIGSSWATGSWADTAWEAGSWADLGSVDPSASRPGYAGWQSAVVFTSLWLLWLKVWR